MEHPSGQGAALEPYSAQETGVSSSSSASTARQFHRPGPAGARVHGQQGEVHGGPGLAPAQGSGTASDLDARIRELEAGIAEDEEALKQRISASGSDADSAVSPELREIAARLPRLRAELASLRKRRARSGGP